MSRLAVRLAVEAELNTFLSAQVPPVPYYKTINERQQPREDLWVSAEFFADYVERMCYAGEKRVEFGSVDINVFLKAGQGYVPAVRLADAIGDHFNVLDLGGGVEIINVYGVDETTTGDANPLYGVTLSLDYQFYY